MEIYKKIQTVSEKLGILQATKNMGDFSVLPYHELLTKVQPLLRENGLFMYHSEENAADGLICVRTHIIDMDTNDALTSSPCITPIKLAGMGYTHSRIALSTTLKRIGILEVLGIAITNEEGVDKEDKTLGSRKPISTNSKEYKELKLSLSNNEVEMDTLKNMYDFTPQQLMELESLKF